MGSAGGKKPTNVLEAIEKAQARKGAGVAKLPALNPIGNTKTIGKIKTS